MPSIYVSVTGVAREKTLSEKDPAEVTFKTSIKNAASIEGPDLLREATQAIERAVDDTKYRISSIHVHGL